MNQIEFDEDVAKGLEVVYSKRDVLRRRSLVQAALALRPGDRVLDVGCAKGFLLHDLRAECPGLEVVGLDLSSYALGEAPAEVEGRLVQGTAERLPFPDGAFDAALCINVVHNLDRERCVQAVAELERVAPGRGYLQVDAYRTDRELEVFEAWVLTAVTYMRPDEWRGLFAEAGYTGAYYWTILEADPEWNDFGLASTET